jgi:arginase
MGLRFPQPNVIAIVRATGRRPGNQLTALHHSRRKTLRNKMELTIFQGRVGDHNDLAMSGAASIGAMLSEQLGLVVDTIGKPEPALNADWNVELDAAMPALLTMASKYATIFERGLFPLTAASRCAVSLATLPVVARHRPDACVVWFDAHADFNTPENTTTGYLGGLALSGAVGLWDSGLGGDLKISNVVLVGARDIDPPEQALIDAGTVRLVAPGADLVGRLRVAIGARPVYVHLDCDVLNPGIVPTDYRHGGGLSLVDLRAACAVIAECEVVGVEIAEFQNAWEEGAEPVSPAYLLDALKPLIDIEPAYARGNLGTEP